LFRLEVRATLTADADPPHGAGKAGVCMSQPLFDPSSKWMLEEQGASFLYLA
jgi:hypothetical protein